MSIDEDTKLFAQFREALTEKDKLAISAAAAMMRAPAGGRKEAQAPQAPESAIQSPAQAETPVPSWLGQLKQSLPLFINPSRKSDLASR